MKTIIIKNEKVTYSSYLVKSDGNTELYNTSMNLLVGILPTKEFKRQALKQQAKIIADLNYAIEFTYNEADTQSLNRAIDIAIEDLYHLRNL